LASRKIRLYRWIKAITNSARPIFSLIFMTLSFRNLAETPFHKALQKANGLVVGLRRSIANTTIRPIRQGCSAWKAGEEIERVHLQIFEETLPVRWRSAGDQNVSVEDNEKPRREVLASLRGLA
jgi:hypothetical protein